MKIYHFNESVSIQIHKNLKMKISRSCLTVFLAFWGLGRLAPPAKILYCWKCPCKKCNQNKLQSTVNNDIRWMNNIWNGNDITQNTVPFMMLCLVESSMCFVGILHGGFCGWMVMFYVNFTLPLRAILKSKYQTSMIKFGQWLGLNVNLNYLG